MTDSSDIAPDRKPAATAAVDPDLPAASGGGSDVWTAPLRADQKAAIRRLHCVNPRWNLIAVAFVAIWIASGWLMFRFPAWPVRFAGYGMIGMCIHALAILMHEGIHGNLFRNRVLDQWVGFLLGAPALFSATAYKVTHALHHHHNRTAKDPDELTNLSRRRWVLSFVFYAWGAIGLPIYLLHVPATALLRGNAGQRRLILLEYALLLALYSAVIVASVRVGWTAAVIHCWILPMIVAAIFGNVRGWAEHMMTRPGHPLTQTRTVTSNALVSFFMCNLNYHLEHHLFPAMPWYNLPKLHRLLEGEYLAAGAIIHRSYLRFVWDALRIGVHGVAPGSLTRIERTV
jgi:fatty acid desaturase